MECRVEVDTSLIDLVRRVNTLINDGWKLQGGICVAVNGMGATRYYWSLTKGEDNADS